MRPCAIITQPAHHPDIPPPPPSFPPPTVIPAKAGIHTLPYQGRGHTGVLDSGLRRNDGGDGVETTAWRSP